MYGLTFAYHDAVNFQSEITGEHTCVVLRPLQNDDIEDQSKQSGNWLYPFIQGLKASMSMVKIVLTVTAKFVGIRFFEL